MRDPKNKTAKEILAELWGEEKQEAENSMQLDDYLPTEDDIEEKGDDEKAE